MAIDVDKHYYEEQLSCNKNRRGCAMLCYARKTKQEDEAKDAVCATMYKMYKKPGLRNPDMICRRFSSSEDQTRQDIKEHIPIDVRGVEVFAAHLVDRDTVVLLEVGEQVYNSSLSGDFSNSVEAAFVIGIV